METWSKLPEIGKLVLECLFYQLDGEPILFVCKNENGCRFLCSCYQMGTSWIIGCVEENTLLQLMDDKITIHEVFKVHCNPKWIVSWDGISCTLDTNVPVDVLPREGMLLELAKDAIGWYKEILRQSL